MKIHIDQLKELLQAGADDKGYVDLTFTIDRPLEITSVGDMSVIKTMERAVADGIKPEFIPRAVYLSKTHGLVEYIGLDTYHGQTTLKFNSLEHGIAYFSPENLSRHFEQKK